MTCRWKTLGFEFQSDYPSAWKKEKYFDTCSKSWQLAYRSMQHCQWVTYEGPSK